VNSSPTSIRSRIARGTRRFSAAVAIMAATSVAQAVVPTPTVLGPLASDLPGTPGRNYPFFATDMELSDFGYVEEGSFFEGTANRYNAPAPSGGIGNNAASASTADIVSSGRAYRSRMLVRRYQKEFILRAGYAWVGVSAQNAGLSNQPNGIKNWSPARYGTLNVNANGTLTGDVLSYDIYSQAAQAIKSVPEVVGGLPVQMVIAIGQSQSAGRLGIYLNAIHVRDPIYDGAVLASGRNARRRPQSLGRFSLWRTSGHVTRLIAQVRLPRSYPRSLRVQRLG
jgi:hypothetical protein